MPETRLYCPSCGEKTNVVMMLFKGKDEPHCSTCGLLLTETDEPKIKTLSCIVTAEDTPLLRKKISEMLEARDITKNVISAQNGEDFLSTVVGRLKNDMPVSLAILDVNMPILNGINAAIALRSIERGMKRNERIPIVFFTANVCDEIFKKALTYLNPAVYINKGAGSSPDEFAQRLYSVIIKLLATK